MQPLDDRDCLLQYAQTGADDAFAQLVSRYLNLVYSVALRRTGDPAAAEEIAQAVFIIFAQKASRLPQEVVLAGWLYETARLCAANYARSEACRRHREQKVFMDTTLHPSVSPPPADETWAKIAPFLDETMACLREADRHVILLRYFEGRSFAEVAAILGASENAAKKRAARGLERLRALLARRGVNSTMQALSHSMAIAAVQSGPDGLATKLSAMALKLHTTISLATAAGTGKTTTAMLVKHVTQTMFMSKLKTAGAFGLSLLVFGSVAWTTYSHIAYSTRNARDIAQRSLKAYAAINSYAETGEAVCTVTGDTTDESYAVTNKFKIRLERPNFYRIDDTDEQFWSDGTSHLHAFSKNGKVLRETRSSWQPAFDSPGGFNNRDDGSPATAFFSAGPRHMLSILAAGQDDPQRERDQSIDGASCYVISTHSLAWHDNAGNYGSTTNRLWIDKKSLFIRRSEYFFDKPTVASVKAPRRIVWVQTHHDLRANESYTPEDFLE